MELTNLIRTHRDINAEHRPLQILFASSEVAPFSKTGGLGDVAAALPKALARRGHHVSILTPLYRHLDPAEYSLSKRLRTLEIPRQGLNRSKLEATIWEGRTDYGVRVFFLDLPELFDREGIYGYDAQGFDDNAERFAIFSRAIIEFARYSPISFDAIHCNDWHTALAPLYAKHYYEQELGQTRFMLTIHNLAYQGVFDQDQYKVTGLPQKYFKDETLTHMGALNFLKAGILYSDRITTVSPTYAQEIQTEEGGCGLHEILQSRTDHVEGVLNGADYQIWAPEHDPHIVVRYNVERLNGKRQNKAELQHSFELPVRPTLPLLGFVGRLAEQKGLDVLVPALDNLLASFKNEREGFQVIFLGQGELHYQEMLKTLKERYPKRVGIFLGYEEARAHQIQAGSDILLVPSRFEPCGLTQMYALRYGTLPLVHATGGLADTVIDTDAAGHMEDAQAGKEDDAPHNTGFVFHSYTSEAIEQTIARATEQYNHYRRWRPLMIHAMNQDFSWNESAKRYEDLYRNMRDDQ